jgi:FtsP/CotA-like multicopper oxidase with cupredoxin domain
MADGAPSQPEFSGTDLTSLTKSAAPGGTVTYSFLANNPGTFLYESGTDPAIQVRMGLFGAIVVRPTAGAQYGNNRGDSEFNPDEEVMVLLSEIDPFLNESVQRGTAYDLADYQPRYWLINGRGFPDSIAANNASWLPNQPYGAMAVVHPSSPTGTPGIGRYLNVGTTAFPFHPHGNNGLAIARDGRPLEGDLGADLSFERFSINLGPGQTWDVLFRWYDAEGYDEATNPVPVTIPDPQNLAYGEFYSGSPYLGTQGVIPVGTPNANACGEFYIISHNHALFQITSWGVPMTGPITYLRIDPPMPNNCGL